MGACSAYAANGMPHCSPQVIPDHASGIPVWELASFSRKRISSNSTSSTARVCQVSAYGAKNAAGVPFHRITVTVPRENAGMVQATISFQQVALQGFDPYEMHMLCPTGYLGNSDDGSIYGCKICPDSMTATAAPPSRLPTTTGSHRKPLGARDSVF